MKVTFLGHSCFLIESGLGSVLIDPFLSGNPVAAITADQVACDAIIVSHAHGDHVGDAVSIANRLNIPVVAVYELATVLGWQGITTHAQHLGGAHEYPFGRVKFTPAAHGSSMIDEANHELVYCGQPASILYTAERRTVFHLGDTALIPDFELIGRLNQVDLMIVPIGDNYTMGPEDAAEAVRMVRPKRVVPCHFDTFPLIPQDPLRFARLVGDVAEVVILQPGSATEV